jgi:Spy/CpxP family protein refolding chaperone
MRRMFALGAALALASTLAAAQGPGAGWGPGNGPGYGMGGGYGQGMMGGSGQGMIGGYGRGSGGALAALNLSDEQQEKIFAIQEDHRKKNWGTMSTMRSEMFKLRRMYNAESVESKGLLDQQRKVDELRRQMLGTRLDMRKQMESVLTPEQRKQARQFGPWWARDEDE